MRLWMANPKCMCRKHLLGEHVEIHMFVGAMRKGTSMLGFLKANLLEPWALVPRHEALVEEMERRGYNHKSGLWTTDVPMLPPEQQEVKIDAEAAIAELIRRCPECALLHQKYSKKEVDSVDSGV